MTDVKNYKVTNIGRWKLVACFYEHDPKIMYILTDLETKQSVANIIELPGSSNVIDFLADCFPTISFSKKDIYDLVEISFIPKPII